MGEFRNEESDPRAATRGPNQNEETNVSDEVSEGIKAAKHARTKDEITSPNRSFNEDDPDRPRWGFNTEVITEYDYHHADGMYSVTHSRNSETEVF